ncbi:hypothetical protein SLS62_006126 [Diatrype stigma]|uniref:Uncharacterized protein n=1 Tax=Diatrype stigma TaxID=117547 RepID=A0AAN9UT96_9PEZI
MSLARALTTRRAKQPSTDMGVFPQRSNTVARGHSHSGSIRNKISSPMELTHTTNMLAYHAPDLHPKSASSTASSKSASDDESSGSARTSTSSPPTSPDIPSVADRSTSPQPNHLSCYFTVPGQKPPTIDSEAPAIPKRSPSHVKKASYDQPAHKSVRYSNQSGTSVSTNGSLSLSRSASTSTAATSLSSISLSRKRSIPSLPSTPALPSSPPAARSSPSYRRAAERSDSHPFGPELSQLTEIAEDYGVKEKLNVVDEEEQELISRGLCRIRPEDYLSDIQELFATFFRPESTQAQAPVWI